MNKMRHLLEFLSLLVSVFRDSYRKVAGQSNHMILSDPLKILALFILFLYRAISPNISALIRVTMVLALE